MALFTNLQSLSQTAGANPPDGSADAPSTIPTDLRLLGSFDAILRDGGHQWATGVSGTNAISITVPNIGALVAGQTFRFGTAGANTGAVTLNVNSLGAKGVLKHGTQALVAGDIANLSTVTVTYDGVNFQLTSVAQSSSLAASGWAKFSNGVIVQWGSATSSSGGAASVSFPITMPTSIANLQLTAVAGGFAVPTQESGSTSGFTFSVWNAAGSRLTNGVNWFAVGY